VSTIINFKIHIATCYVTASICVNVVSVTILQTFSCHDVGSGSQDDGAEEYMTADYSVSCDSGRYTFAFWWAVAMVLVYPIGAALVNDALMYVLDTLIVCGILSIKYTLC